MCSHFPCPFCPLQEKFLQIPMLGFACFQGMCAKNSTGLPDKVEEVLYDMASWKGYLPKQQWGAKGFALHFRLSALAMLDRPAMMYGEPKIPASFQKSLHPYQDSQGTCRRQSPNYLLLFSSKEEITWTSSSNREEEGG